MARHPALDPPEVERPAPHGITQERLDPPAGHRRGRGLIGPAEAEQQPRRAAGLGGELQPAAGQKIERFELHDHNGDGRRAQRFVCRPENLPPVLASNDEQPGSVDAEAGEPRAVEPALAPGERRIRAPDEGTRLAQEAAGEGCREARGETAPHLVQRPEWQPAPGQRRIDRRLAQCGHRRREAATATGEAADLGAQFGKDRRIGQGRSPLVINVLIMFYADQTSGQAVSGDFSEQCRGALPSPPETPAQPSMTNPPSTAQTLDSASPTVSHPRHRSAPLGARWTSISLSPKCR